jgi:hypothetical protein
MGAGGQPLREKALVIIGNEFGDLNGDDLAIAILEKYHPKLKPTQKVGRKEKWLPLTCATLAVWVNHELQTKEPKVVWLDLADPKLSPWHRMMATKNGNPRDTFLPPYLRGEDYQDEYELANIFKDSPGWFYFVERIIERSINPII